LIVAVDAMDARVILSISMVPRQGLTSHDRCCFRKAGQISCHLRCLSDRALGFDSCLCSFLDRAIAQQMVHPSCPI
jgi:hypothetical protein